MAHKVVVGTRDPKSRVIHDYSTVVSRMALGAGFVFLLGSLFDFWILWFGPSPGGNLPRQLVTLTRTAEGFPRLLLATALIYIGCYVGEKAGPLTYRVLAGWLLALGLAALLLLALLGLSYPSMSSGVTEGERSVFRWTIMRLGGLSFLYVSALVPLGVLGFQTRKR